MLHFITQIADQGAGALGSTKRWKALGASFNRDDRRPIVRTLQERLQTTLSGIDRKSQWCPLKICRT